MLQISRITNGHRRRDRITNKHNSAKRQTLMSEQKESARRVLVVGCGSIGKRHIRNLLTLGGVSIIACDPEAKRRDEVTANFNVESVEFIDQAWMRTPHVCIVAAPTALHMSIALDAAEHGCHLLIEKPLSHSDAGLG